MKQLLKKMAITLVLAALCLCFASCEDIPAPTEKTVNVYVSAGEQTFEFTLTADVSTIEDVVVELAKENENFTYVAPDGDYGLFITEMCGFAVTGSQWWGVNTDTIKTDADGNATNVFVEYTTEYKGKTYYSTATGISSYVVTDGETILFVLN